MVAWQMIGFPGAYASYYDLIDQHGIKIDRRPMSLAEDVHGHVHIDPGPSALAVIGAVIRGESEHGTPLTPVDVVTIGVGLTGSLAALELAKQGLKVVGLERGAARDTVPDFQSPAIHDELAFFNPKGMMQDNVKEAVTFRNSSDQTALPIRRWESFCPGLASGARSCTGTAKVSARRC